MERNTPSALKEIAAATRSLGFTMGSDMLTGSLLRTLAVTKPEGKFLELGTGTGLATAWILDGMDARSSLQTVDADEKVVAIARQHLGHDARVTFNVMDGATFIASLNAQNARFDLIFADTWPGKYTHLDETLLLLKPGGLYIIDDLLAQPSWSAEHAAKAPRLIAALERRTDLRSTVLNWSSGLLIAAKVTG